SQKALNMSKLKASIAWEHSHKSDPVELPLLKPDESADLALDETIDNKTLELTPLEEFGQFLDIWIEISKNEIDKIAQIYEDENKMLTLEVEDIVHPATDPKSKWDLR
ncbi:8568_t:CDS:2, partial [Cetraspora pellucida]